MAKYKNGILGAFSGKVGPIVGASWRGIDYMRTYTSKIKNPNTLPQKEQRSKMSIISKFVKPIRPLLNIGWRLRAINMTPSNAATQYLISNAIMGDYPNFSLNPEKILISSGTLMSAKDAKAIEEADCKIKFTWDDNSGTGTADPTDLALILIFSPEKFEATFQMNEIARSAKECTLIVPETWKDDTVICYIGFISANRKEVSDSVYLGEVPVI
jgi:hypothetical protein